jgi:DNA-binding NarL/FixJ family response regulator
MKRIFITTDQLVVGHGIIDTIRRTPELELVGSVGSRVSVPPLARRLAPDIVLVDHCGPTELALERLTEAEQRLAGVKRVLLTSRTDPAWLDAAFAAGANAIISRDVRPAHLGVLLVAVAEGYIVQRPTSGSAASADVASSLTPRELEILRLAARGFTNRRIAARLWVTEQTVKFHLSNTYRKLGVTNRTEATHYAYLHALVEQPLPEPAEPPAAAA